MKKLFCLILAIIFIISFTACNDTNNKDNNEYVESDTNEAVYEKAIKLIDEKKFSDAIAFLEKISNYKDSQILLFKANYIEGCIAFNNKDFHTAYECFDAAEIILRNNNISQDTTSNKNLFLYTVSIKNESAYHYGAELVNNGNHVSALDYFEKIYKINSKAEEHMKKIISHLLDGNWIGTCTVENVQFQVEMSFDKDAETLFVSWVDRRNGYKTITSATGRLNIYADKAFFSDRVNQTELVFNFYANNKMNVNCNGTYEEKALYEGTYEQKSALAPSYKITDNKYTIYDIPDFYNFSVNGNSLSNNNPINSNSNKNNAVESSSGNSKNDTASSANNSNSYNSEDDSNENANTSSENSVNSKPQDNNCDNNYDNDFDYADNNSNYEDSSENQDENKSEEDTHTHRYTNATCTQPPKCSCGKTSGSALGHKFSDATCTQAKTCERCGLIQGNPLNHDYDSGAVIYCKNCNAVNPNAATIISNAAVKNNDGIISVLDYSIENFKAKKNYYTFTLNYSIVCNEEKMNYYMKILAQNSNGNVLAEQTKLFNQTYINSVYYVFKEGQTYNANINFTIDSKEPITTIIIGG